MNILLFLGLREYSHLPVVKEVMATLAAQSEKTFLKEWLSNHRVMENYNSETGVGCDSGDAVAFYHWGGLTALTSLIEKELV
jgi:hypothetical protein